MVLMPQPQFLHQAVLQREVGALDAALGWTAVRTPYLDIELVHRAAKLRDTACAGAAVHRPEHARAVAVERDRLAVARSRYARVASKQLKVDSVTVKCSTIRRLVASSTYTSSVHAGARSSHQACSPPSLWTSSP